ncbi:uncharacterized protein LOC134456307 [Engraulis encrasicolus]|uniref:uncharacterized protein LOC134456307 n=1 Tax=Engraulis encrasicolus TaxID=184585 RepID=UPI002FD4E818
MAFCPRTFHQREASIGTDHQTPCERVLSNSAREMDMASHWRPQSEHPYQYVRSTRFSSSKYWKEYQKGPAVSQEQYSGLTNVPTSAPQTLRFVGNLRATPVPSPHTGDCIKVITTPSSDDTAAWLKELGPLKFVGNVSLPAEALHGQQNNMAVKAAQMPGSITQGGVMATVINPISSTSAAPVSFSIGAFGGAPTPSHQSSGCQYSREDHLEMIELHGEMLAKYRQLRFKAENVEKMMKQSAHSAELQKKTEGNQDRSWDEEMKDLDDLTGRLVLPDDAIEKLEAIPGILDLAKEMGFSDSRLMK